MRKGKAKAVARIGKALAKVAITRTIETGRPTISAEKQIKDPSLERQGESAIAKRREPYAQDPPLPVNGKSTPGRTRRRNA